MNKGTIVTFYSYKGGVGRTFALANIGALLSLWGYRTLCVDWDLEAPGLHLYFKRFMSGGNHIGLVEMIQDHADGKNPRWQDYTTEVSIPDAKRPLLLVSAGLQDASYVERMQVLDWTDLYGNHNFGNFLEAMREDWKETLDFVLVDSRTGISDIGGICTVQLPDILALLFTANDQSLYGGIDIAKRARRARASLPIDRAKLVVLPIAARFEGRVEVELADEWLKTFEKELAPFFNEWSHRETPIADLLNFTRIPYVPYWSFGEKLPVIDKGTKNPDDIGFSLETLAALVAQQLSYSNVLVGNRDTFVISAKKEPIGSVWSIPYARNPLFTGREEVLKQLYEALRAGKTAAISGLGGIGKTQTAVEYAYRYKDDYQAVLWVNAESRESLISDFVSIAHLLNLPEKQEQEQHRIVEAVKRWFEDHADWLLIFDNADDLEMVRDFLPTDGKGYILLTTRAQATRRIAQRIEIEEMDQEEGAFFLLRRATILDPDAPLETASITDRARAREISQAMDGLPLALDQAGAYIEDTQWSLTDYLHLFQTRKAELLQRRGKLVTDHPDSVGTTWSLAFEKVQQASPAAADLLRLCTFLDPDVIQEEIITKGASELGSVLQPVAADPIKLNDAIGTLLSYSLVRRNPDHTLSIQRLVQVVLKHSMNKSTQRRWAERAVRAVNQAFPEVAYENWLRCQEYIPQALTCNALIDQWDMAFPEATQLLNEAGYYLTQSAQYEQAEPLLQRALAIRERVMGAKDPLTAASLNNLAELYRSQGKYEEAEPLYQRALTIRERVLGADDRPTAASLNNLAELYYDQGKYEEAEPLYQRALTIRERVLGADHPATATSLNNLAELYRVQGKYEQAEPLLQRALMTQERVLGPEHPDTASTLDNLALLYADQGNYEQAEPLYQRALSIYERVLGPEHPYTLSTLNNLAILYSDQGKYEEAEPLYQRVLAIREKVLGPEHPYTATTLNNLAILYSDQGKYEEAEALYQRALVIYERVLGPEHPDTVQVRENYTDLLQKMKKGTQVTDPQD